MAVIKTENLTKIYTRFEKEAGLKGSIKSLFHREKITKTALKRFDLRTISDPQAYYYFLS